MSAHDFRQRQDNLQRWFRLSVLLAALSVVALLVVRQMYPPLYDPLNFPQQTILNRIPGVEGPAMYPTDHVQIEYKKCSSANTPLKVEVKVNAQELTPSRDVLPPLTYDFTEPPGCYTQDVSGPLGADVIQHIEADFKVTHGQVQTWIITGTETPLGHQNAASHPWATEAFRVYPAIGSHY